MPKGYRKPQNAYEMEKYEVAALLHAARSVERDTRAYYMLAMMYLLGLRIGEAILLEWTHLGKLDGNGMPLFVSVPTLKQRDEAPPLLPVPVLSHPKLVLAAFDESRAKAEKRPRSRWLFGGAEPLDPLSKKQAHRIFENCRDSARLNRAYTPHVLRHTATVEIGKWETTRLAFPEPSVRTAAAFLRHSRRGGENKATEAYMRATTTTWARYRGALDLPELRAVR